MKKTLITIFFCISLTTAFTQTLTKKEKIKELLELTGSGKMGVQVMQTMLTNFKQSFANVPEEFWDNFMKEVKPEDLVNLIIPIYDKHYSEDEVDQLLVFYKTPLGKKVIQQAPSIMQESMEAGKKWGEEIGLKVYEDLKKKGYVNE